MDIQMAKVIVEIRDNIVKIGINCEAIARLLIQKNIVTIEEINAMVESLKSDERWVKNIEALEKDREQIKKHEDIASSWQSVEDMLFGNAENDFAAGWTKLYGEYYGKSANDDTDYDEKAGGEDAGKQD